MTPIDQHRHHIAMEADKLRDVFGARALAAAQQLLDDATAARNHKDGILYAEVCGALKR